MFIRDVYQVDFLLGLRASRRGGLCPQSHSAGSTPDMRGAHNERESRFGPSFQVRYTFRYQVCKRKNETKYFDQFGACGG